MRSFAYVEDEGGDYGVVADYQIAPDLVSHLIDDEEFDMPIVH